VINSYGEGKSVTVSNAYVSDNLGGSISVTSKGPVVWTDVNSYSYNEDSQNGALIDNSTATLAQPVTITRGEFNNVLFSDGLSVKSEGNITLTDVSASNNYGYGILLNNVFGTGSITINANNSNGGQYLNQNGKDGLYAQSRGAIKLAGKWLQANDNHGYGIRLDNSVSTSGVTVTGLYDTVSHSYTFGFNNNSFHGLNIISKGPVVVSNISSVNNRWSGIMIGSSSFDFYPSAVTGSNLETTSNWADGLDIYAKGPVTLTNILASYNSQNGVNIDNTHAALPALIKVKKGNFNNNGWTGLYIQSNGNVTVDSIMSNYNSQAIYVGTDGIVTLLGSLYTNQFNGSFGGSPSVDIESTAGAVTLNKFSASNNNISGVYVYSFGKLTVTDGVTSNNNYSGFVAETYNGAAITNLIAYNNGASANASGIHLYVYGGNVSFNKSSFVGNAGHGIFITGSPVVTMTSTTYYGNDTDNSGDTNYYIAP
jgi:hypothetical protein